MSFNIFIIKVLVSSINVILLPLTTARFSHSFRLHCKLKKVEIFIYTPYVVITPPRHRGITYSLKQLFLKIYPTTERKEGGNDVLTLLLTSSFGNEYHPGNFMKSSHHQYHQIIKEAKETQ